MRKCNQVLKKRYVIEKISKGLRNVPEGSGSVILIYESADPDPKEICTYPSAPLVSVNPVRRESSYIQEFVELFAFLHSQFRFR